MLASFVDFPVHAYLFVGPAGTGKRAAARAFSAALICPNGGCGECAVCKAVLAGQHPDVVVVERQGASISIEEARDIVQQAQLTPRAAERLVLMLTEFHLVDEAGPALLKTIEEPPDTTVIIVLADVRSRELETIASRCVEVEFVSIDSETIAETLLEEGVVRDVALAAATGARGSLERARLRSRIRDLLSVRRDGARSLIASTEQARRSRNSPAKSSTPAKAWSRCSRAQQEAELEAADKAAKDAGLKRTPNRKAIEDRHRRELRRVRTDELPRRSGVACCDVSCAPRLGSRGTFEDRSTHRHQQRDRGCVLAVAAQRERAIAPRVPVPQDRTSGLKDGLVQPAGGSRRSIKRVLIGGHSAWRIE